MKTQGLNTAGGNEGMGNTAGTKQNGEEARSKTLNTGQKTVKVKQEMQNKT